MDYRDLHAGPGRDANGKEFHRDHLSLFFRSGLLYPIFTRSGREAGFVYQGEGHYAYKTASPSDLQSFDRNIQAFVGTNSVKGDTLEEDMTGCVVLSALPVLGSILGPGWSPGGEGPPAVTARIAAFLEGADDAAIGVDHFAAKSLLSGSTPGILYAEIDGQGVDPGYLSDPLLAREESLLLFRTIKGDRFGSVVSSQPLSSNAAPSPVLLSRLDYSLVTPDNSDADAVAVETIAVSVPFGRLLAFALRNHYESAVATWESTTRALEVRSVKVADGTSLPFSHRYHELLVELPAAPEAGSTVTLRFELAYHFLKRKDGNQFFWLGGSPWYPIPSWNASVNAICHWNLRTRKPYVPIAPGRTIVRKDEGEYSLLEAEMQVPTDFPVVFGGRFITKEFEKNGVKVRVNVYGPKQARAPEALGEGAFALLDAYGKMLQPYPYREMDVVMIPENGFWQSPAGLVLISADPLSTRYANVHGGSSTALEDRLNRTYAHEFGHQWWGNLVTPADYRFDNWISESISEYLGTVIFSASGKDAKEQASRMQESLAFWRGRVRASSGSVSIAQAGGLRGSAAEDYFELLYAKGPLVVHMLRTMMGNDAFFQMLKTISVKYANSTMTTARFAKEASPFCGEDMQWFFRQWIEQPGIPDLAVRKSVSNEGGKVVVTGHLSQAGAAPFKLLLVPFVFDLPGGGRSAKLVRMDKPEMDYRIELPAGVSNVVVDPAGNNLVNYN